jgi:glyoxylase-like metal-dependent hydrolase (beta-lactamase superfamily II)
LEALDRLGIRVFERGWLSSNNVVFHPAGDGPLTVVDTGFSSHAAQTVSLLRAAAGARGVARIVNTHLHSDHCGGNSALQSAFGSEVWVPEASFGAAREWDAERLSFGRTDQRCERFSPSRAVRAGEPIELAGRSWLAVATPGHDPEALVFFQPEEAVLIAGDALWEDRLAVIFPELEGEDGFTAALDALDQIEALRPRVVIPGHGRPFTDVSRALRTSRDRLARYMDKPERHYEHSVRVLVMFHLLEVRREGVPALVDWLRRTPIFARALHQLGAIDAPEEFAHSVIGRLVASGSLRRVGTEVVAQG